MPTVYFLGAGASAADGLPLTAGLNYGIANWMRAEPGKAPELHAFYRDLFNVRPGDLTKPSRRWEEFLRSRDHSRLAEVISLPDLIETLSLIDISIAEGQSFGVSSLRSGGRRLEMDDQFLRIARRQLTRAIAEVVKVATRYRRCPLTDQLVDAMGPEDVIVSTNWDVLPERYLVRRWKHTTGISRLTETPVRYHCVGERAVDWRGEDLNGVAKDARSLLRLHGGINWLGCACCATVYMNLEFARVVDESRREHYDECHCGAGLSNIIIAPSFVKDYNNIGLRSVWREAHQRLEQASRWVFIGYSLPSDDFHVRALLLRALRSRSARPRAQRSSLEIQVFLDQKGTAARDRYLDFFRIGKPEVDLNGFQAWAAQHANQRR